MKFNLHAELFSIFRFVASSVANDRNFSFDQNINFRVFVPKDKSRGDLATNIAFPLAKVWQKSPSYIANVLAKSCIGHDFFSEVRTEGGFINIFFNEKAIGTVIKSVLSCKDKYGLSPDGNRGKVNVEFVSANPTGPMHIGHARGAVLGDTLCSLLSAVGFKIFREYYINDAGAQIEKLVESLYLRYKERALGIKIDIPEGLYPGNYLVLVADKLFSMHGKNLLDKSKNDFFAEVSDFALSEMMNLIREDLSILGIKHDIFTSEKKIMQEGLLEEAVNILRSKGFVYEGTQDNPKGVKANYSNNAEEREQDRTLFKSSAFGDDVDRCIFRSDGSPTYFACDIAYHWDKIKRGYDTLVLSLGKDHAGYAKRIKAAVLALSDNKVSVHVFFHDLVRFLDGDVVRSMSKRDGNIVGIKDVVNETGLDAARFILASRDSIKVLDFDFESVKQTGKDNPVFYAQYARARSASVAKNANEVFPNILDMENEIDFSLLKSPEERALFNCIAAWPSCVELSAENYEPWHICTAVTELAAALHAFWSAGNERHDMRCLVTSDRNITAARIALVTSAGYVLDAALGIIGVSAPKNM